MRIRSVILAAVAGVLISGSCAFAERALPRGARGAAYYGAYDYYGGGYYRPAYGARRYYYRSGGKSLPRGAR